MIADLPSTADLARLVDRSGSLEISRPGDTRASFSIRAIRRNEATSTDAGEARRVYEPQADGSLITRACLIELNLSDLSFLEGPHGRIQRGLFKGWLPDWAQRYILAHELGHCLDEGSGEQPGVYASAAQQAAWTARKERFADAYAARCLYLEGASARSLSVVAQERLAMGMRASAEAILNSIAAPFSPEERSHPAAYGWRHAQADALSQTPANAPPSPQASR